MGGTSTEVSSSRYDWSDGATVTRRSAASYAAVDRREYTGYTSRGLKPPKNIDMSTESLYPEIIILDVTGSMRHMPKLFLEKLSVLYEEVNAVLQGYGPEEMKNKKGGIPDELALNIIAVGDAYCDNHPLQVTGFQKRAGLVNEINKIYPEGGGGGTIKESYELGLYYALKHCKTPNVPEGTKPLCVVFGDEAFYDRVNRNQVRDLIGDTLEDELYTTDVIKKLSRRFEIYVLRPELSYSESEYRQIHTTWENALGPERVKKLEHPERVVDTIVGLNAMISDNWEKGVKILKRRQTEAQVNEVIRALHPSVK